MSTDAYNHNPPTFRAWIRESVIVRAIRALATCCQLRSSNYGHVEITSTFTETETNDDIRLFEGNTELTTAVRRGQTELVPALISAGIDISARRYDGESPLNVASCLGFTDIVRILLDNGADIESRNIFERTPLFTAVLYERHDVLTLLIERGADVNVVRNNGDSPELMLTYNRMTVFLLSWRQVRMDTLTV